MFNVRVEVRVELGPVGILATNDEPLPYSLFVVAKQPVGNRLEVAERFLGHAAFGMAGFVAVIAIARAVARKQVHHGSPFAHVVKAKSKETRTLAIDHGDAERGLGSKQSCQGFQLKAWLQINLGGS